MSINASATDVRTRERTQPKQLYWTWCVECGEYVIYPEIVLIDDPTWYICENCR